MNDLRFARRALAVLLCACATSKPAEGPVPGEPQPLPPPEKPAPPPPVLPMPPGLDEAVMDPSTDPCTDFYQYACGGWMAKTEIPEDKPLYTRGFIAIADRNEKILREIGDDAAAGKLADDTPFGKQLRDYFGSCMDEAKLEDGIKELKAQLPSGPLPAQLAWFHLRGMNPFFSLDPQQDLRDSSLVIGGMDQAGLGLPDRDYYVDEDKQKIRDLYLEHMKAMFALWGAPADQVQPVFELETRLAKAQQTQVERRDPKNVDHRIERAGVKKLAPGFAWDSYFDAMGQPRLTAINVSSETYFKELNAVFKETKPATVAAYLQWVAMRSSVSALSAAVQAQQFKYESAALTGAKVDRPRWKKCVALTDQDLPQVIGREFVRRTFGADAKATTKDMVDALSASMKHDIETVTWMDAPTKDAAEKKLERMVGNNKIGYPDAWRDYTGLTMGKGGYLANRFAARMFEKKRQLGKIGKPLDRKDWFTTPATVNAYNQGQLNEIVFPAGILQPPFFNKEATDAVNFGSMGMVVGHEITHGFDDQGRKFDVDGKLRDWWSPASGTAYVDRDGCIKRQFDSYLAIDALHVKGDLTLGENTADLGGLKIAHAAMTAWPKKDAPKYRFTPSQQFFLGFAQAWCTKMRPETARLRAATDSHSPPYWRVNGPLGNLDEFRIAFSCHEGAPMIRKGAERCEVW
jgi:endothelin-converting enzyme/putative endopeptidase